MSDFLAIAREPMYSPGKVEQDRAILEAVAEQLAEKHRVRLVEADERFDDPSLETIVFAMCQGPAWLERLRQWENAGMRVVNSAQAVENCHRRRMLTAFERSLVPHPESFIVATDSRLLPFDSASREENLPLAPSFVRRGNDPAPPPYEGGGWGEVLLTSNTLPDWTNGSFWMKRGDVHAMQPDDVVLVHNLDGANEVRQRWRKRGISDALLQRHVEGDVFKFYAVRGGFFHCLQVESGAQAMDANEEDVVAALAKQGAEALGLEVYGGDCVRDPDGGFWLIDLNDWPSYGACRTQAAGAIAAYLNAQTRAKTT